MAVTITFTHKGMVQKVRAPTIHDALTVRLGRPPTTAEDIAEVDRILRSAADDRLIAAAEAGNLPHQRGRL